MPFDLIYVGALFAAAAAFIIIRQLYYLKKYQNKSGGRIPLKIDILISGLIIVVAAVILIGMGRTPFGPTDEPGLWTSETVSQNNSQRLADPYTLTHLIHGI